MRQLRENLQGQNPPISPTPIACDEPQRWIELLEAIAGGDRAALGRLYDETSPLVFGLLRRILGDRAIAEEILLEVFKQVWRQASQYDARRRQPLAWILTIARTRALACRRAGAGETKFQSPPIQKTQKIHQPHLNARPTERQSELFISQQRNRARAALSLLSSPQREVIELAYYEGLSPREIAARLGLSVDMITNHLRSGMMELRDFLRPMLQEQL